MNRYQAMGIVLLLTGLLLGPFSFFALRSVPLSATGGSVMILGMTSMFLGRARAPGYTRADSRLMISLAIAFGGISILLTLLGQQDFTVYLIAYSLAFLVVTIANVGLSSKSRTGVNIVASIVFVAFLTSVFAKVTQIIR